MTTTSTTTVQDAEAAVLGALLMYPEELATVRPLLPDAEAFLTAAHRALFGALLSLAEKGSPFDAITVRSELANRGHLERVPEDLFGDLVEGIVTGRNAAVHAQLVRDAWFRRRVIEHANAAITLAQDTRQPVDATIATIVDRLAGVSLATRRAPLSMSAGMFEVWEELEVHAKAGSTVTGLPSRLPALDRLTHGWQRGSVNVIAARPSVGKSSFAFDCALGAAGSGPVYIASSEMPSKQIRRRMLARESGLNLWDLTASELAFRAESRRLEAAVKRLSGLTIRIEDGITTPAEIRLGAERFVADAGERLALIIVDYLQKLHSGGRSENRNLEIGRITGALGKLAIDLDVPILLLSQLSRDPAKDKRRPTMVDLRDSGSIEQDADLVLFLHPKVESTDAPLMEPHLMTTELILDKHRNGETGVVTAHHDKPTGRWTVPDRYQQLQPAEAR